MARGKSTKLLATLPDDYSADWLGKIDKRTKVARAVLGRIQELESDAGGYESLSAARRSLIRHAAWLDAVVESHELKLASGQEIDSGAYTQSLNSLIGLLRLIGLERRPKKALTLREVMNSAEPDRKTDGGTGMKLHQFMLDHKLVGKEFSGPSWVTWRVIARLIDGDAQLLTDAERDLALKLTGRTTLPEGRVREIYVGAGRRGGKSRFGSLVATWLAAQEYPQLSPGETAVVAHVAPDRRQAGIDLSYAKGLVEASPLLRAELSNATQDTLTFNHGTALEVATASFRTVRGRTLAGAVVDESAFLRSDDAALPDVELVRALRPALLTLRGLLLVISSPHRKVGLLYEAHRRYFGNDEATRGLYIQASSRDLNPTLDEGAIADAMEDDPAAAQAEYLGVFRADLEGFLDDATVDGAIVPGRRELPRVAVCRYVAFCDPSGGRQDAFTLAIAHSQKLDKSDRLVLDAVRSIAPPFDPETAVQTMAATMREYGITEVSGDQYAGEWVPASFRKHGVTYKPSERNRSEIYLEMLPQFSRAAVELLDLPQLRTQLLLLERRTRSGGRDSVDHPRGAHDDLANSVCGALLMCVKKSGGGWWTARDHWTEADHEAHRRNMENLRRRSWP